KNADEHRLGAYLDVSQSPLRLSDRHGPAAEAPAGAAGGTDQLFCSGLLVLFLLLDVHHHAAARDRFASDELLLSRLRLVRFSPAARVSGGSHLAPSGIYRLRARVYRPGRKLLESRRGHPLRR